MPNWAAAHESYIINELLTENKLWDRERPNVMIDKQAFSCQN